MSRQGRCLPQARAARQEEATRDLLSHFGQDSGFDPGTLLWEAGSARTPGMQAPKGRGLGATRRRLCCSAQTGLGLRGRSRTGSGACTSVLLSAQRPPGDRNCCRAGACVPPAVPAVTASGIGEALRCCLGPSDEPHCVSSARSSHCTGELPRDDRGGPFRGRSSRSRGAPPPLPESCRVE